MRRFFLTSITLVSACSLCILLARGDSLNHSSLQRWTLGKGWGWVWGNDDERGALNEMTDASRLASLHAIKTGRVFDLGVTYDRDSFKWPGHNPGEIITFRSPEGIARQGDFAPSKTDPKKTTWHSCAVFVSDNVGTQIDGLGHAVEGLDRHWYNNFNEENAGGDFGIRKCDAAGIPPIIARGVLIDVAGAAGLRALPPHHEITPDQLQQALDRQKTKIQPGSIVLIRTGAMQFWNSRDPEDRARLTNHDSAGITIESARWLVEQKGAMLIGSDTSGLEYWPEENDATAHQQKYGSFMPVHNYLLIEQGVHIGELHDLEELAREKAYEFTYICATNKLRGTVAGFALRPIAIY